MKSYLVSILLFAVSCVAPSNECKYSNGIFSYFQETLHINLSMVRDERFYVVPLEGCSTCVISNLEMLNNLKKYNALTVVGIGLPMDSITASLVDKLKQKTKFIEDRNSAIYQYETGFSKPLLIEIHDGQCHNTQSISDDIVSIMPKQLDEANI